jgi:DNA helicase-2/ATP-dependent DNA helicase PcrA
MGNMERNNTEEQLKVINHPIGVHAKVLAVAGSGKTTTMVERVKHLILNENVNPGQIQVLMFNRMASEDFNYKLKNCGLAQGMQPAVNTFHSIALRIVQNAQNLGVFEKDYELWTEDRSELYRNQVYTAFNQLRSEGKMKPDIPMDRESALTAIDFWKGSLIKPENAGWKGKECYHLVYALMEEWRVDRKGMTFDDMILTAVDLLKQDTPLSRQWKGRFAHIIVDEYQDINYAQQKLVELLADSKADVMVVGDDDQTIYEWRGARPAYILGEFEAIFKDKLLMTYTLSHSFRFGPMIAQYAENCITHNHSRKQKSLISYHPEQTSYLRLIEIKPGQETNAAKEMADVLTNCVRETQDAEKVIVLARSYMQLGGLEAEMLRRGIPHRIEGGASLLERIEIKALRQYLDVASKLDAPLNQAPIQAFTNIVNYPKRYIRKADVDLAIADLCGLHPEGTFHDVLRGLVTSRRLSSRNQDALKDLLLCLEKAKEKIDSKAKVPEVVDWLIKRTSYLEQFDDFYGKGKPSLDRKEFVSNYRDGLAATPMDVEAFLKAGEGEDTTFGAERKDQIVLTTIHRTKGLEFDYVLVPNCNEGFMPTYASESDVFQMAYDTSGKVKQIKTSDIMDNERRLFYVAITRARKGVIISSRLVQPNKVKSYEGAGPSRFLLEMQIEPTRKLMDALTCFALSQNEETEKKLKETARENGEAKLAIKNLHARYLKDMGCTALAEEIARISETHLEEARRKDKVKTEARRPVAGQASKWWDKQ